LQCERNTDYVVCNKALVETILDAEFKDPLDKGFFYAGNAARRISRIFYPTNLSPVLHVK